MNQSPEKTSVMISLPWEVDAIGGVSQVVENIIRIGRTSDEFDVHLLIPDYDARSPRLIESTLGFPSYRVRIINPWILNGSLKSMLVHLGRLPISIVQLRSIFQRQHIKGINAHYPGLWCLTLYLALRLTGRGGRLVLSFHGADLTQAASTRGVERWLWSKLINAADCITCCSDDLKQRLIAEFEPGSRVVKIKNGIDRQELDRRSRTGVMPTELVGRRFIASAGTFEHKKGQDILLRAFACVYKHDPGLTLYIAGRTGPALANLQALVEELGLSESVVLAADVPHDNLLKVISEAEAFVLSSREEPFGIVLLEAAYLGIPLVATSVGGIPEIWEDQVTALLVPDEDVLLLQKAIEQVIDCSALRGTISVNARQHVIRNFGWEASVRSYLELTTGRSHPDAAVEKD